MEKETIKEFRDENRFLSNFWEAPIMIGGLVYPTVEHFYQSSKAIDPEDHEWIRFSQKPGEAKKRGRRVKQVKNWDEIKLAVMYRGVMAKFVQHKQLALWLLDTGDAILQEGNTWGDTYWGIDLRTGIGENHLGKVLMEVREYIKKMEGAI